MAENKTPVPGWISKYKSGGMSFDKLKTLIAQHKFEPREGAKRNSKDKAFEAYGGADPWDADEPGTLDELVYSTELNNKERRQLMNVARVPDLEMEWLANPPGLYGVGSYDDDVVERIPVPWLLIDLLASEKPYDD